MPAIASLVLTDRATPTPVDHTFVPVDRDSNGVWILEKSGVSTPIAAPRLTILAGRVRTDKYRARIVLRINTVQDETINGVVTPKVVRTSFAEVSFTLPTSGTLQERKDIVSMIRSALDSGELIDNTITSTAALYA